jgi:predicted esterase
MILLTRGPKVISQISIVGFSQGSMLATYYSPVKKTNFHSIVSLSGSLPDSILEI